MKLEELHETTWTGTTGVAVFEERDEDEIASYVDPSLLAEAAEMLSEMGVKDAELVVGDWENPEVGPSEDDPAEPVIALKAAESSLGVMVAPRTPDDSVFSTGDGGGDE